MHTAKIERTTW